jgi:predicted small secreted protein
MKKIQFIGLPVLLLVLSLTLVGCPTDGGGGDDIIKISTAEQFTAIRNQLDGHYVLEADIDLSGYANWEPIGVFEPASEDPADEENPNLSLAFTGIFDGNGHKISNVTISIPAGSEVGLFGCVAGTDGVVKNLVVENVTVSGMMLVGGVIGYGATTNTIKNVTLQGNNTITGYMMAGGIVGGGFCPIADCNATVTITADNVEAPAVVGILAGGMEDASIINCTATGTINAAGMSFGVGGLAACALSAQEVTNCTVDITINITGAYGMMIGGLLGYSGTYSSLDPNPTVISNCTVNAVITAPESVERIGGIVGSGFYANDYKDYPLRDKPSSFKVKDCSTSGSITGGSLVGTIAGYTYDNSTVEDSCTSTMAGVTGGVLVGGDKTTVDLSGLK